MREIFLILAMIINVRHCYCIQHNYNIKFNFLFKTVSCRRLCHRTEKFKILNCTKFLTDPYKAFIMMNNNITNNKTNLA